MMIEGLSIAFTAIGKCEFLAPDQVFHLLENFSP